MNNCKSCSIDTTTIIVTQTNSCEIINDDPLYNAGNCSFDENGNPIITPTPTNNNQSCVTTPSGLICPVMDNCSPWDLTESPEACLISDLIDESLEIGGAVVNVYRLLGIHEQGSLQDLIGTGTSFSSGFLSNYSSANAFDKYITEWRSAQLGIDVVKSAFIGYDFGPIKLDNGRNRYGIETAIKHDVSRINIKQGCDSINRVNKIRIERSNDGSQWFGVSVLNLPDCDGMVSIDFNRTVPSRFWRIKALSFNGGNNDYWSIQALQFVDYEKTNISNIQDRILLENRDRDYDETPRRMKGAYTPIDVVANQSKFGMFQGGEDRYVIEVSFTGTIRALGRPFVIGDIIQLPSETQYTPTLAPVQKYLEITDVGWSVNGYTPTWVPTMLRLIAVPAIASQETQDLFGKLTRDVDDSGLVDIDNGQNLVYQDNSSISQTISADANTMVPERGEDTSTITQFSEELLEFSDKHPHMNIGKANRKRTVYAIDALPPNGESYTEGDEFPSIAPIDGSYHRLTYNKIRKDIPPRLYRYSAKKKQWIYLETDRRFEAKNTKPRLQEFLDPEISSVTPTDEVGK